jgi:epoxyqueuosine reductase
MSLVRDIKQKAIELGFDLVGISDASPIDSKQVQLLTAWLKSGCAGRMSYMHKNLEKRTNPAKLLENARSVICVGLNYHPPKCSSSSHAGSSRSQQSHFRPAPAPVGKVARYAQYEDYHSFIRARLRSLARFIGSAADTSPSFKICVDTAPLAERALAARAGLGFIGKNHMLINPELGPEVFLGQIITDLQLQPDRPIPAECSGCERCINACPTAALTRNGGFDANKCISYLTIEYKDLVPPDLAAKIGDRLYGCDECVLACPFQQNAPACANKQFRVYHGRETLDLHEVLSLGTESFKARFADSPVERTGPEQLKRNAKICLANVTTKRRF